MEDMSKEELEGYLNRLRRYNRWERERRESLDIEKVFLIIEELRGMLPDFAKNRVRIEEYEHLLKVKKMLAIFEYDE